MKYLIYTIITLMSSTCVGQVYEAHEVDQKLIDKVEASQQRDNLYRLPSILMMPPQEDSEKESIRDLFPWRPKPAPQPAEPSPPTPEPPKVDVPSKPLLPPMPWKPQPPSPDKEVQERGLVGRLIAWLKSNFPILGGSVSLLVNISVFLAFLYVFYMVSEFAKATTNKQNWVAFILREPFVQAKGLLDSFRKKK
jgi:hypothetical protein